MDWRTVPAVWMLCAAQTATAVVAAIVAWVWSGKDAALAALFGGAVAVIPALFFAGRVGLQRNSEKAKKVLATFYQAELGKLLLTALLFFIGARLFGNHFAPLIFTCMACLAMHWLILAVARTD